MICLEIDSLGDWQSNGCSLVELREDIAVLKCDHLTNFALMKVSVTSDLILSQFKGALYTKI